MIARIRRAGDEGMTLIELIISVMILGLIMGPLVMVLEFAFSSSRAAAQRTTDSSGAQLLGSYFVADVQAADLVWTQAHPTAFSPAPFTTRCGHDASAGDASQTVLEVQSQDAASSAANVTAITYDVMPDDTDASLVRHTWTVSGSTCTNAGSVSLVDRVSADPTQAVSIVCDPVSCSAPDSVHITVNAFSTSIHNASLYSPYTIDLTATRRETS